MAQHFGSVDEYIASFPAEVLQELLQEIQRNCRSVASLPRSGYRSAAAPGFTAAGCSAGCFAPCSRLPPLPG
ncbi:MAG: hypothetical protein JWM13_3167 [Arthrobacter sp.]|jgi:hypothetical protein|nr:hypothetical protein [Arthrobacter sp.]